MDLKTLEEAARQCGKLILEIRSRGLHAQDKADSPQGSHFLTEADTKSQELGISILHEKFPEEIIIAEEQEHSTAVPADCTVFDPVDGTTVFYNGGREFGVTLCTLRGSQPVQGVIYFPVDDLMFTCERGHGVHVNGKQLPRLSWNRPLDKTMIGTEVASFTVYDVLQKLTNQGFVIRSIWVGVYGARAVLLQETGMYYHLGAANIWDGAAGALMVQEAGGVAVDPWGKPLQWNSIGLDWVLAANQELADVVLQYTKQWAGRG